jgi:hypothetical protein
MQIGDHRLNRKKNPHGMSRFFQIDLIDSTKNCRLVPNATRGRGRDPSERIGVEKRGRLGKDIPGCNEKTRVSTARRSRIRINETHSYPNL